MTFTAHSQFFYLCGGPLNHPKAPKIDGLDKFAGSMFHTARWNYDITGGAPEDAHPELTGLRGKKVGILGTGVTAVQAVVELAKWAGELYVFQRTPSSIGVRGQGPQDPEKWKTEIAYKPGVSQVALRIQPITGSSIVRGRQTNKLFSCSGKRSEGKTGSGSLAESQLWTKSTCRQMGGRSW